MFERNRVLEFQARIRLNFLFFSFFFSFCFSVLRFSPWKVSVLGFFFATQILSRGIRDRDNAEQGCPNNIQLEKIDVSG